MYDNEEPDDGYVGDISDECLANDHDECEHIAECECSCHDPNHPLNQS
jgi:hypothetical protein